MSRSQQLALDFVEAELARELELRSSLEQRAGGLVSTYSALVAAGVAIAALIRKDSPIDEGMPLALICIGGVVALMGVLAAVAALTPLNVGAVPLDDLKEMVAFAATDSDTDAVLRNRREDVGLALVDAINDAQQTVKTKALANLVSASCLVLGLSLFASAVFVAL